MKEKLLVCLFLLLTAPAWAGIVRVVSRDDGGVSVIYPSDDSRREGEAEDVWLKRVFDQAQENNNILRGRPYDDINAVMLPSREYRDAWTDADGEVLINAIKKEKIDQDVLIKEKIETEKRAEAVDNLIKEGKLPVDFIDDGKTLKQE